MTHSLACPQFFFILKLSFICPGGSCGKQFLPLRKKDIVTGVRKCSLNRVHAHKRSSNDCGLSRLGSAQHLLSHVIMHLISLALRIIVNRI